MWIQWNELGMKWIHLIRKGFKRQGMNPNTEVVDWIGLLYINVFSQDTERSFQKKTSHRRSKSLIIENSKVFPQRPKGILIKYLKFFLWSFWGSIIEDLKVSSQKTQKSCHNKPKGLRRKELKDIAEKSSHVLRLEELNVFAYESWMSSQKITEGLCREELSSSSPGRAECFRLEELNIFA